MYGGPQSPDMKQGYGISEDYIGHWLAQGSGRRDKIVLATKLYQPMGTGPNDRGLSDLGVLVRTSFDGEVSLTAFGRRLGGRV